MPGPFDQALFEGTEAFHRGDMATARVQLQRALKMKPWDDPDLLDVHRRLGDLYYQWGTSSKEDLEQAEKHYVQFLRLSKSLMDSPAYAITIRQSHPYCRTPEKAVFDEYVAKLSGVYMASGVPVEKSERKAKRLGKAGCFVATASYGTDLAPEVVILRRFRDEFLARSVAGRIMVRFYEHVSPPIADAIAGRKSLRFLIRLCLIRPAVGVSRIVVK